jgi:hypothetical protein
VTISTPMPTFVASGTTADEPLDEVAAPPRTVIETVTAILGYDVLASEAEGYREMADESIRIAEGNLAASAETLPKE